MSQSLSSDEKTSQKDAVSDLGQVWSPEEEARLVRKIDLRCMPTLIILFILNFIDRGNLANARLKGLQTDLKMNDTQFATSLSVFFAGYISMQVPSNLIMNSIPRPRLYMSVVAMIWGLISGLTALCNTFSHLVVCRLFLGFVEAAFYPSAIYYLSRWYTSKELGFRIACLNGGNMLAQGLGGLLAAGILSGMEGSKGIRGWRWLFIIEGAITVFVGALVPFLLADYPSTTKWLSDKERVIAQGRLVKDVGLLDTPEDKDKSFAGLMHGLWLTVTDLKVWLLAFVYITYILGLSFGQYLPTITKGLGFSTTVTLLLTFPPWAFATVFALFNSWHSDRVGEKFYHAALSYGFALLGYIVALSAKTIAGKYIALFGMCMGFSGGIILIGWVSTSIPRPPLKRAAAIAFVNMFGNIGQIPGSYMWPTKWGTRYWRSFTIEICVFSLSLFLMACFRLHLKSLNKKLDEGELDTFDASEEVVEKSADLVQASAQQEVELRKSFRYIL